MPRTTTAEQVKKSRRRARRSAILILLLLCAAAGGLLCFGYEKHTASFAMLHPYEVSAKGANGTENLEPFPLFGENLAAVLGNVGEDPAVTAEAGITFNASDGTICFSKNALERLEPASVTKVMTCLVALKYGDLDQEITVEAHMLADLDPGSSLCHIIPDCTLTLEQLLYGLMLPSGNDAANVIAYGVAGSEEAFVELMNQEAKRLGAAGTHYSNAHGLSDPNHYTTAYDIYLIYREAMKYEKFIDIISTQEYTADFTIGGSPTSLTWGRGIWYFNGKAQAPDGVTPIGGKTGTTPEAGYCLSLLSEDASGTPYVSVVLKASGREDLYANMTALLSKVP